MFANYDQFSIKEMNMKYFSHLIFSIVYEDCYLTFSFYFNVSKKKTYRVLITRVFSENEKHFKIKVKVSSHNPSNLISMF